MSTAIGQLLRYGMTGGAAAVVDIGLFHLLIIWGGAVFPSACASFLVAAAVNYVLTSSFVFRVGRRTAKQAFQFMLFLSLGFVLNTGLTIVFHEAGLPPTLAKTVAVGIVFFSNFFVNRTIVFRQPNALPLSVSATCHDSLAPGQRDGEGQSAPLAIRTGE